jgi:hypothetical protein
MTKARSLTQPGTTRRSAFALFGFAAVPTLASAAGDSHLIFAPDPVEYATWRGMVDDCPEKQPPKGHDAWIRRLHELEHFECLIIQRPMNSAADMAMKVLVSARWHEVKRAPAFWAGRVVSEQAAAFLAASMPQVTA